MRFERGSDKTGRMKRVCTLLLAVAVAGCGVSKSEFESKSQEAETAKQQAEAAKKQLAQVQQQLASDDQQITELKNSLGLAQSQAITDDQKAQLEEAKHAVEEAQARGKLLEDLSAKFKQMIDAGRLKITTRHGRIVLQLHDDVLFDAGEADVKPDGKKAVAEIAATLRGVGGRRFQVAGHTDAEPLTAATKKKFPTNWELSTARAIAVVKLLTQEGIDPGMLSAAGYGPYDPVASNGTSDGQAKNRRIEISLVPNVAQLVAAAGTIDKESKK
jgi:chemotaxis protein MotB